MCIILTHRQISKQQLNVVAHISKLFLEHLLCGYANGFDLVSRFVITMVGK